MSHLPLLKHRLTYYLKPASTLVLALIFFLTNLSAQKVGVNTDTPLAGLHILSDDGLLIQGEFGNGNLPVTGFGTRMLFNPKTGAFRSGRITDENGGLYEDWWNFFNVGDYSIAAGINTKAAGYASVAFGHKTQANGLGSFVAGGRTNAADGDMSFAAGFENTAHSYAEFVIGQKAETYAPNGISYFDLNDRLFVVANGNNAPHNALTILKNGNVGINITTPQYLLDINGTTNMEKAIIDDSMMTSNLRISNGATNGYLLQSDANGNASWASPTSILVENWTLNGNDIYNNNSGDLGIGTILPGAKLHVVGNMIMDAGHISFQNSGSSVFIGNNAGQNDDLISNANVYIGENAGQQNISGTNNIALGENALQQSVSAGSNIALGKNALQNNTTGGNNIAMGVFPLTSNTTGDNNIALGFLSLNHNTSGATNIGIGVGTLTANTTGSGNVAAGLSALHNNTTGNANVSIGEYSLFLNSTGSQNVAIGQHTLESGLIGAKNVALGYAAGNSNSGSSNTMIGYEAGKSNNGSANVFLGYQAGTAESGSNKLYIDNSGTATPLIQGDFDSNEVTINDSLTVNKELSVGTSVANSTLEVNGSVGAKFKTPLVAGTTNPDDTGMVWRYNSGSGTITLPGAGSCPNRMYVIINQTGSTLTISTYRDLITNNQTSFATSTSLWLISDGAEWWQIK